MSVSLLYGWVPWALRIAAIVALVVALARGGPRWWTRWVPVAVVVALVAGVLIAVLGTAALAEPDPLPSELWVWLGLLVFALFIGVAGWRGARPPSRVAAVVAVVLLAGSAASTLNEFVGYYPTVGAAVGELTGAPVPGQVATNRLGAVSPDTTTGRVVPVTIPKTLSGFTHRQEFIYLPPAWFRSADKSKFPVVEMIGAEFAEPDNWIRSGDAVATADAYARAHHGWAPILVFTDASGGFAVDTECVDGPHGNAEGHLDGDIPAYLAQRFHATLDPARWAVAGWSMGGTCAVDLAVEHPERFHHFLDIAGDLGPNIGDKAHTIATLYGGNTAAWAAHDPLTVLAARHPYAGVTGVFADGTREHRTTRAADRLADACRQDGIDAVVVVRPGGHTWPIAGRLFAQTLPSLVATFGQKV